MTLIISDLGEKRKMKKCPPDSNNDIKRKTNGMHNKYLSCSFKR